MSNKYLEIAKQLKKGQSKKTNIGLKFSPFYAWYLIPQNDSWNEPSQYDAEGNYIGDNSKTIAKARKDKKKKPEVRPAMYEVEHKEYNFLAFELSLTVVKRVA